MLTRHISITAALRAVPVSCILAGLAPAQTFQTVSGSIPSNRAPAGPVVSPAAAAATEVHELQPTPPPGIRQNGLPQPDNLPTPAPGMEDFPADFKQYIKAQVTTVATGAPATLWFPVEPSVAFLQDTGLMVANNFAALSKDSGKTWTTFDPTVMFPPRAGGGGAFGGDQRVLYIPQRDVMVWYIQYRFSVPLNNGNFKLVYFVGRNALRSLTPTGSFDITPQLLGVAAGHWLDFPDLAFSDGFLYGATNVFLPPPAVGNAVYAGNCVWRADLPALAGGNFVFTSIFQGAAGLASNRFTQGAGNTMRWASNRRDNSTVSLWYWVDTAMSPQGPDHKAVPAWNNAAASCPGPAPTPLGPNRDWAGYSDHRILGGWLNLPAQEFGFMWDSAPIANRPMPFVRTAIFRTTDHMYLRTEDTFSPAVCYMYPAAGVNARGHVGVVVAGGSSSSHVSSYGFIVDNFVPSFAGQTRVKFYNGTDNPPNNRWGDYLTVVPHPVDGNTWIGTGMCMRGGAGFGNQECHSVWFGRERDEPTWVNLNVQTTNVNAVPITVDETDRNGNKNGATPFARSFAPRQGYTLIAPLTVVDAARVVWDFERWSVQFAPGGGFNDLPLGQNRYVNSDITLQDDTAEARYVPRRLAACFVPNLGNAIGSGDDVVLAMQPIGFPFPFGGTTWSHVHACTNGFLYLSNAGVPSPGGHLCCTGTAIALRSGSPKICPFFNDLDIRSANGASVYLNTLANPTCTVITWDKAVEFGDSVPFTVQCQLYASGEIRFFYSPNTTMRTASDCLVGCSPAGGAADPGVSDLSAYPATAAPTVYELFNNGLLTFDLNASNVLLTPNGAGYTVTADVCDLAAHGSYGAGCYSSSSAFYELFASGANDLSGLTVSATQQNQGGFAVATAPISAFVPPTSVGLALGDDQVSAPQALGFTWDYPGGATSSIVVDSNGRVLLGGTTAANYSATVAGLLGGPHMIAGAWTDLVPDGETNVDNVFFETDGVGEARITWRNVPCYEAAGASTFQIVLIHTVAPGGDRMEVRFQSLLNNATTNQGIALVGFATGPGTADPGNRDLTAGPFATTNNVSPLLLSAAPAPIQGGSVTFTTANIPAVALVSAHILSFLQNDPMLPLPGAPGCGVGIDLSLSATTLLFGSPTANNSFAIPLGASWSGARVFSQSASLVPGINALGAITSNGLWSRFNTF